jgi:hypothetical protein
MHDNHLTLVDCGTHPRSQTIASPDVALAQHLGGRLSQLTSMIVTHFDIDHWGGLLDLVRHYEVVQPDPTRLVGLIYPGMPVGWATNKSSESGLRAGLMAFGSFMSSSRAEPVNVVELTNAWSRAARVAYSPAYRGSRFYAHGREWLVHWPPARVSAKRGQRFEEWLEALKSLADKMAEDPEGPYPRLKEQLEASYASWEQFESDVSDLPMDGRHDLESGHLVADAPLEEIPANHDVDRDVLDDEELGAEELGAESLAHIPAKYHDEVKELAKGMQGIDNYLSLVVSAGRDFISFGDVEGSALGELLKLGLLGTEVDDPNYYFVMLPPHHGSHRTHAQRLPEAVFCVAQNGSWLQQYHSRNHVKRHKCGGVDTHSHGTIVLDSEDWWCICPDREVWHL